MGGRGGDLNPEYGPAPNGQGSVAAQNWDGGNGGRDRQPHLGQYQAQPQDQYQQPQQGYTQGDPYSATAGAPPGAS
jgi:hypothetical protein